MYTLIVIMFPVQHLAIAIVREDSLEILSHFHLGKKRKTVMERKIEGNKCMHYINGIYCIP